MNAEIIKNINNLPDELINKIKEYLPKVYFVFTNKQNYLLYHHVVNFYIKDYYNYLKDTILRDNDFVFEKIVQEQFENWNLIKNYIYRNMVFIKYIYFVIYYCIENDSNKCYQIISRKHGLCKNLHKKNIIKNITWKN